VTNHISVETKKILIIRGLPGSGKSSLAKELKEDHTVIEVDLIDNNDKTLTIIIAEVSKALQHNDVILDGIFTQKRSIMSIFTSICDTYPSHSIRMEIREPQNLWSQSPLGCWLRTIKRAKESKGPLVSLTSILDMKKRWEKIDALIFRDRSDPRKGKGIHT
jgi:GTPase SAR1 family protein